MLPHTHWDREWYLPFEAFRDRLVETLELVLDLVETDPSWSHFHLDGHTAMIDDYLAVRPDSEARIKRLVSEGRLSCGPWVTLVDEFLVSGESIFRNLEDGLARADDLGGAMRIGYLPDQFGHIGQMPQILTRLGIEVAVVWRGVPSAVTESDFGWSAPDGSTVHAIYLPHGYSAGGLLDSIDFVESLRVLLGRVSDFRGEAPSVLVPVGDDHRRPDPELPRLLEAARAQGIDADIVSLVEHAASRPPPRQAWRGELRSAARANLLPNTYSARAHQKIERGRAERLIERYAEPLAALVPGFEWPHAQLEEAWSLLHLNGAHDSVCGCSADAVADAVDARAARVTEIGNAIRRDAMSSLASRSRRAGVLMFNPSAYEFCGIPPLGFRVADEPPPPAMPVPLRVTGSTIVATVDGHEFEIELEDQDDGGDLYTFSPQGEPAVPREISADDVGARVVFEGSTVVLRAWHAPGDLFVRVIAAIENRMPDHRIRAALHLPESAEDTTAGSPFEIVDRPDRGEGGASEPGSTQHPARGFVFAGGRGFLIEGVAEYELASNDRLALTLLRCTGTISRPRGLATRHVEAGPDVPTPAAQMIGRQTIPFGVAIQPDRPEMVRLWERYALKLLMARAPGGGTLADEGALLALDAPALSSVRKLGEQVAVRIWNPHDRPELARVGDTTLELGPHAIATVLVD